MKAYDNEPEELEEEVKPFNKKKVLIYVLPIVVAIGLLVSFIIVFTKKDTSLNGEYSIVSSSEDGSNSQVTVFYSLPELSAALRNSNGANTMVKLKLNIELSSIDDIKTIEAMLPRINDTLLAHIVELTPDELSGSNGLYNLKKELLYRINMLTSPIKILNLNFKTFDIQKNN